MLVDRFIVAILLWFWCYDLPTVPIQSIMMGANVEVPVAVIEQAYMETFSWNEGGLPEIAYQHLTAGNGVTGPGGVTNDVIWLQIEDALANGNGKFGARLLHPGLWTYPCTHIRSFGSE